MQDNESCIKKWGNLYEKEVWQINQGECASIKSNLCLRFSFVSP